ncbi:hypothetical protein ACFX13_024377 [Malus domestica]|jgi:hypothetical protein
MPTAEVEAETDDVNWRCRFRSRGKKSFPCRKKCLRTISDELTLSEAVDLTAPNLEVCFDPSLPWPDRAHIDPEEKTCPKGYALPKRCPLNVLSSDRIKVVRV